MIFLILALALILRLGAINFGLPHLYHADEPMIVNHAVAYGTGDLNPHFFKIPPLVSYLLFLVYGLYFLTGRWLGLFRSLEDFEFLFYSDPTSFYLLARIVFGVFLGTVTIYIFYRLLVKFFSREVAWVSAFLLAVCFLHVRDSHYIYADIPLVVVLVLAFFFLLQIPARGEHLLLHLGTGAVMGLAAATKYNGLALVLPYLYLSLARSSPKGLQKSWPLAAVAALGTYGILNPYSLLDYNFFWQEIQTQAKSMGGVGISHHLCYSLAGSVGPPLLLAALAGILTLLKKFDLKKASFAVFIGGYYALLCLAGQPYERYVLPLVPFVIFFAADFTVSLVGNFKKNQRIILGLALFFLALVPLSKSLLFNRLMLAKDTRTLAKEWVEKNIPSESHLALGGDFYMPRLAFSPHQLSQKREQLIQEGGVFSQAKMRKLDYLLSPAGARHPSYHLYFLSDEPDRPARFLFATPLLPYDLDVLKTKSIDYVAIVLLHSLQMPVDLYARLQSEAQLVAEFNPYRKASRRWPYERLALTGGPFLFQELLQRHRNGPIIQIYKVE